MPEPQKQTTVGGVRAVELQYRPLREIATGRTVCYLSRTNLNTPALGTLMPEAFRAAAEFSGQSRKLFPLEAMQLAEAIRAAGEAERVFDWFSVYMPMRVLKDGAVPALMEKICEQFSVTANRFCFSVPEQILTEQNEAAAEQIARLRRRGFHMMLENFGESGTPFLKLSELPVDYVMLSPSVTAYLEKGERSEQAVHSIISFINELGCEPIADGVRSSTQAALLYEFGCNYCAGALSGGYATLAQITH